MRTIIGISKRLFFLLTQKTIYISLLSCLFVCQLLLTGYGMWKGCKGLWEASLLLFLCGSFVIWTLLAFWEKKIQHSVNQLIQSRINRTGGEKSPELGSVKIAYEHQIQRLQTALTKNNDDLQKLHIEMDKKIEEMRLAYLEFEDLRKEYRRSVDEAAHSQIEYQKTIENKDGLINEYQKTIFEQRRIIEKKQNQITRLESKAGDLMLEIKKLLQLEGPSDHSHAHSSPTHQTYDLSLTLQKYISKVENLTGVEHLGYVDGKSPRFLDLSLDGYAVDRRRLFDSFKEERGEALFIYEPCEKKMLFVHSAIKSLTGFNAEKFIQDYPHLIAKGYHEWEELITRLKILKKSSTQISVYHKTGELQILACYLGLISKGPFTNHVLGLFTKPSNMK